MLLPKLRELLPERERPAIDDIKLDCANKASLSPEPRV